MVVTLNHKQLTELGVENQSDVEHWISDFSEFVYAASHSRINKVRPLKYNLPEIRIAKPLDKKDHELKGKYSSVLKDYMVELGNIEELSDEAAKEVLSLIENRHGVRLSDLEQKITLANDTKIGPQSSGCYHNGIIKLNSKSFSPKRISSGTIVHELLHALREQALGQRETHNGYSELDKIILSDIEKENRIDTSVVEFFSQFNDIVLNDIIGSDRSYAYLAENEQNLDLDGLVSARNYILKHRFSLFPEFRDALVDLNSRMKQFKRKKATMSEIEDLRERYVKAAKRYSNRIRYFNEKVVDYLPLLDISIGTNLLFAKGALKLAADTTNHNLYDLLRTRKIRHTPRVAHAFENKIIDNMGETDTYSLIDSSKPYSMAKVAIGENRDDILKNWPKILGMSSEDVKQRYFKDVTGQINLIFPGRDNVMAAMYDLLDPQVPHNVIDRYTDWISHVGRKPNHKELDLIGKTLTNVLSQ